MKRSFFALLATFAAVTANAGSFGPPPFSNGSPLVTGVDGSYQASARATNLSGIIRFQYTDGVQSSGASANSWIFFVNGVVQRGSTVANINSSKVDGVLDSIAAPASTNSGGAVSLPTVFLNANNSSSGFFRGKMSANGNFSGNGELQPLAASTTQVVAVDAAGGVTTTTYTTTAGTIPNTSFKFKGVRASTPAGSTTN